MRKPIIAANWKMHKAKADAEKYLKDIQPLIEDNQEVEIVLCVPFTLLDYVGQHLTKEIALGAQNIYPADQGAYTGEISARMLLDLGVSYVLVGHSERRQIFNENNEFINEKIQKALEVGLTPILCVGETLEEREQGLTKQKCQAQILEGLKGLNAEAAAKIVVAYEPIWAIGTGRNASAEEAEETIAYIRLVLAEIFNAETAAKIRIQYGGSVKPDNIRELMQYENIDGALVGGAGLDPGSFAQIVNYDQ